MALVFVIFTERIEKAKRIRPTLHARFVKPPSGKLSYIDILYLIRCCCCCWCNGLKSNDIDYGGVSGSCVPQLPVAVVNSVQMPAGTTSMTIFEWTTHAGPVDVCIPQSVQTVGDSAVGLAASEGLRKYKFSKSRSFYWSHQFLHTALQTIFTI